MHNHTLGWTSDNGSNVFAVGWLTIATIIFTPGGGMDDDLLPDHQRRNRVREEQEFLALLIAVVSVIERDRAD